jgi:hypothetical protein
MADETQNEAVNETAESTAEQARNSPDATQFANIWNQSESRKDALTRFSNAGFTMTYSAMVARVKSYRNRGVHLKEIASAPRGRRLNVEAVNAAIDAQSQQKQNDEAPVKDAPKA